MGILAPPEVDRGGGSGAPVDPRQRAAVGEGVHHEVQADFAFGQQVIGVYDSTSNTLQAVIVNK
ncbi:MULTISPECIES: hypothetical protein [unclassified Streptomyces]|uniref:hypothetical protein n=1 Tax=unclassified Streptomyces TaxID=2593676 RepID=UPI0033D0917F